MALKKQAENIDRSYEQIKDDPAPKLIKHIPLNSLNYDEPAVEQEIELKKPEKKTEANMVKEQYIEPLH